MDEDRTQLRLSDEAISLFFLQGGFAPTRVDLRPYFPLARGFGSAVIRAAERWGVQPDRIVV